MGVGFEEAFQPAGADGVLEFLGADVTMPDPAWESDLESRVARLEQRIEAMGEALTA